MKHAWTGGQYSLLRALLGGVLAVHFARRAYNAFTLTGDATLTITLACAQTVLCLAIALGTWHRAAALLVAAAVVLFPDARFRDNAESSYPLAALLVLCACSRPAPYLSVPAIGRADPSGSWILPDWVYGCGWILLSAVCLQTMVPGVERALWHGSTPEVVDLAWGWFGWIVYLAPFAIPRSVLPFAWIGLLGLEIDALLVFRGSIGLPLEQCLLFAAAFDPGWIAPRFPNTVDSVFYDGHCGLCHRLVRFLLAEDRRGAAFRFAPLDSDRYRALVPIEKRATLPDSVIVLAADGQLLSRSRATRHALSRLGGVWRLAAIAAGIVPTAVLDRLYDFIAGVRHRLFRRPPEACPLSPAHLRRRFDA